MILSKGNPAFGLDGLQTERAVAGGARQDHSDRLAPVLLRERAEEMINGPVVPTSLAARRKLQGGTGDDHVCSWWDDVNMVRLYLHLIGHLSHGHDCCPGKNF